VVKRREKQEIRNKKQEAGSRKQDERGRLIKAVKGW
jgi:hypothetical protein